jgi:hypothetical protein
MKPPKTIKTYIKLIRMIESIGISTLSGYEKLTEQQKDILIELTGQISNIINEYEDEKKH